MITCYVETDNDYNKRNRLNPGGLGYNAADQLVTRFGHTYSYNGAGNLAQDNNIVYAYTPANLLQSVTNGSAVSSMTWDAAGNRVSFTSSTDTQNPYYFVYDTTAGIPAIIEEITPTGSVYYIRESNGSLIARLEGNSVRYYHFNDIGSTLFLTDGTGVITDRYAYDAWGKTTHEGETQQPYQYVGEQGYYTHYQDENLPLLQLGVRSYDPEVGRFTQRDPILANEQSCYAYGNNNPLIYTDGSGMIPKINCPRNKNAGKLKTAITRICDALKSGKLNKCTKCTTGPKHLQCLKDFCDKGTLQCGSRDCVNLPGLCGHSWCTPGKQNPDGLIVICNLGFTSACDGQIPGNPVTSTLLHEMMHTCGVLSELSAEKRAMECIKEMLK